MKKPLLFIIPLIVCLALILYAAFIFNGTQDNTVLSESTGVNPFDDIEVLDPALQKKIENRHALTDEEWRIVRNQRVEYLAKFDIKAAHLEAELQEKGYLGEEDHNYLSAKLKELEKLLVIESRRKFGAKPGNKEMPYEATAPVDPESSTPNSLDSP